MADPAPLVQLKSNAALFRSRLEEAGFELKPGNTAIVPVMLHDAALATKMAALLLQKGVYGACRTLASARARRARVRSARARAYRNIRGASLTRLHSSPHALVHVHAHRPTRSRCRARSHWLLVPRGAHGGRAHPRAGQRCAFGGRHQLRRRHVHRVGQGAGRHLVSGTGESRVFELPSCERFESSREGQCEAASCLLEASRVTRRAAAREETFTKAVGHCGHVRACAPNRTIGKNRRHRGGSGTYAVATIGVVPSTLSGNSSSVAFVRSGRNSFTMSSAIASMSYSGSQSQSAAASESSIDCGHVSAMA